MLDPDQEENKHNKHAELWIPKIGSLESVDYL